MIGETKTTPRITTPALSEIHDALQAYWAALDASELSEGSKGLYMDMAEYFVRWLAGDYAPGSRKEAYPIRKKKRDSVA
jgi:hypothetical protein